MDLAHVRDEDMIEIEEDEERVEYVPLNKKSKRDEVTGAQNVRRKSVSFSGDSSSSIWIVSNLNSSNLNAKQVPIEKLSNIKSRRRSIKLNSRNGKLVGPEAAKVKAKGSKDNKAKDSQTKQKSSAFDTNTIAASLQQRTESQNENVGASGSSINVNANIQTIADHNIPNDLHNQSKNNENEANTGKNPLHISY